MALLNKLIALVKKETLVLSKDVHGLVVLFVMPAVFILIMSMAMQDAFDEHQNVSVEYAILNQSDHALAEDLVTLLQDNPAFKATAVDQQAPQLDTLVAQERFKFAIIIPRDFPQRLTGNDAAQQNLPLLQVLIAPTVKPYLKQLFVAMLRSSVIELRLARSFPAAGALGQAGGQGGALGRAGALDGNQAIIASLSRVNLTERYVFTGDGAAEHGITPTSVQQNVPAWIIFAMFFVIIPISTSFIIEKQQGTFVRLRMMNISALNLMLAKLAPYYIVNQIQMAAMIAVGMCLVPLLGGDRLNWPSSLLGLLLISSAASAAAISFALFVATVAKTTVQATTLGGVFNIIFGALGGIMVPKFVMPPVMQDITVVSPMSWGLQGFLDVFLRNAHWTAVIPEALALLAFAAVCLTGATVLFKRLV